MTSSTASARHRVVVVGGGFGGLEVVRHLRRSPVHVTLVDRRNFHLFQPLLYQVATGALSPANIAAPLRHILRRQKNCEVLLGEVDGVDMERREVSTPLARVPFDTLVVAAGARYSYFGHPEWEALAPGLKTIEDATQIRGRVFRAFEVAEMEPNAEARRPWLNFVIVGGGPTGVELAGALAEIAKHSLRHDFRNINPSDAKILLIEAESRVLSSFPPDLSARAEEKLRALNVEVHNNTRLTSVDEEGVVLTSGDQSERIPARTVLWAAGVHAAPLSQIVAEATGITLDRAGRIVVEPDLSVPGHPNLFVIGDMASYTHQTGHPLPGVAPVAMQEGAFVARLIDFRLRGRPLPTFRYRDRGTLATIGRSAAVAAFGKLHLTGLIAWILWLVVHLLKMVGFRNRMLVLVQWSWSYFTHDRSARLITDTGLEPPSPTSPSDPPAQPSL